MTDRQLLQHLLSQCEAVITARAAYLSAPNRELTRERQAEYNNQLNRLETLTVNVRKQVPVLATYDYDLKTTICE